MAGHKREILHLKPHQSHLQTLVTQEHLGLHAKAVLFSHLVPELG